MENRPTKTDKEFKQPLTQFLTPQARLVKPMPSAFLSTGIISKKHRQRHSGKQIPATPAKKLNFLAQTPDPLKTDWLKKESCGKKGLVDSPTSESPVPKKTHVDSSYGLHNHSAGGLHNNASPLQPHNGNSPLRNEPLTPVKQQKRTASSLFSTPVKSLFKASSSSSIKQREQSPSKSPLRILSQKSFQLPICDSCVRFISLEYIQQHLRNGRELPGQSFSGDYFESHFQILDTLGQGAFARAFKVYSRQDSQLYTVKRTIQPYSGHKDRLKKLEEVEILYILSDCSRCVKLFNAWEQYGYLYLQMELCEGGNLERFLEEASRVLPVSENDAWRILGDLALGLEQVHSREIVHLDLKPANVLLKGNNFKLADFGLATFYPITSDYEREGDRTYIAPEILTSNYGPPADIFSLGLVILEIVADIQLPPNGDYWLMLRRNDFSAINFGRTSPMMIQLIQKMLSADPAKRPTASEILRHPYLVSLQSDADGDSLMS